MLFTEEGRKVMEGVIPLSEYPTPQFRRDSYLCLNGEWEFEVTKSASLPLFYSKRILVPFAVETPLSNQGISIEKTDFLHYRTRFSIPAGFNKGRVLLHFEAVDQICDVFLNGVKICHHEGGYDSFCADCHELVEGQNELCVVVTDDTDSPVFPRGKQTNRPGGIWYTPTSGIWGTVWLESVPKDVITKLRITPDFDRKNVFINVAFEGKIESSLIEVLVGGNVVASGTLNEKKSVMLSVASSFHPWSPIDPFLYDLRVRVNSDQVDSYFAMRKFSAVDYKGFKVFGLNNKPYFLKGVLDQGYWPDGGLTPPSDQAMIDDIETMKSMGFNMLRKHIKVEPLRWYYHCDRLGIIVIQDIINAGGKYKQSLIALAPFFNIKLDDSVSSSHKKLGRALKESRERYAQDLKATINRLYNCPCIAIWTLFNEGWGQFDSIRALGLAKHSDDTRLLDVNSGWFDQGVGDFDSHHVYFRKVKLSNKHDRILSLSEFGGYSWRVSNHVFSKKNFGYRFFKDGASLTEALGKLMNNEIAPLIEKEGLSVTVYTQLSDVEEETNGLLTYDRKHVKVPIAYAKGLNQKLCFAEENDGH